MIVHSHDPTICRCDYCRAKQSLIDTGGWEWIDDGRPARKPKPGRHWSWYVIDVMVLAWVVVLLVLLIVFGG